MYIILTVYRHCMYQFVSLQLIAVLVDSSIELGKVFYTEQNVSGIAAVLCTLDQPASATPITRLLRDYQFQSACGRKSKGRYTPHVSGIYDRSMFVMGGFEPPVTGKLASEDAALKQGTKIICPSIVIIRPCFLNFGSVLISKLYYFLLPLFSAFPLFQID